MTWQFEIKNVTPIFMTAVGTAAPNSEHAFPDDGRHDLVNRNPDMVRVHHVCARIEGSSTSRVPPYPPYTSSGFADDSPLYPGKQTGPFAPMSYAKAGPDGCVYMCVTAKAGVKLDYEVFHGPHRFNNLCCDTYALVAKGCARIDGTPLHQWNTLTLSHEQQVHVVDCDSDAIVFYIWQRFD